MTDLTTSQQVYWDTVDDIDPEQDIVADGNRLVPFNNRYKQGKRSHSSGFIAYVVFAGREVGVFYNWSVISLILFLPVLTDR